jgi:prepilin-type N-terminal cleavage/methylation domain-containing protein
VRRTPSPTRSQGFTLVELLLVLGIILIIGGTVIMAARYVGDRTTTTRMVDQSTSIVQSVDAVYTNSLGYDTALSPTVALNNGALSPSQMTGGELRDSLGHPVSLSSAARSGQDGAALQLGFEQLPSRICSSLASAAASGFDEVKVGGTTVKGPNQRVVDIAAVTSACVGDNAAVTLVHYSPAAYQGPATDPTPTGGASGTMPVHGSSQPEDLTKLDNTDGHYGRDSIGGVPVLGFNPPAGGALTATNSSGTGVGTSGIPSTGQTAPPGIDQPPAAPPAGFASISGFQVCLGLANGTPPSSVFSRCKTFPDQTLTATGIGGLSLNCGATGTAPYCPNDAAWQAAAASITATSSFVLSFSGQLKIYMRPDPTVGDTFTAGWATFNINQSCSGLVALSGAGNPNTCYFTLASGDKKMIAGIYGYISKPTNQGFVQGFVLRTVKAWPGTATFDLTGLGGSGSPGSIGGSVAYQWVWAGSPLANQPGGANRAYCYLANYTCTLDGKAISKTAIILSTDTP